MLGEESHKATLDSSAGDNRIVCTVIYTARHREVSSTLKGLGSLANSLCLPYGNKIPIVPPRLLWGPHYLFSIQLKIIKSSSKHMPEGIGHFINKWRTKKMICPIMLLNCKIHLCSSSLSLSPVSPTLSLGPPVSPTFSLGWPVILCSEITWGGQVYFTLASSSWSFADKGITNHILPWRKWF